MENFSNPDMEGSGELLPERSVFTQKDFNVRDDDEKTETAVHKGLYIQLDFTHQNVKTKQMNHEIQRQKKQEEKDDGCLCEETGRVMLTH